VPNESVIHNDMVMIKASENQMSKKVMHRSSVEVNPSNGIAEYREATPQNGIPHKPKTPLGLNLQEVRAQIIAAGIPLLGPEEIEKEVAERRGGQE